MDSYKNQRLKIGFIFTPSIQPSRRPGANSCCWFCFSSPLIKLCFSCLETVKILTQRAPFLGCPFITRFVGGCKLVMPARLNVSTWLTDILNKNEKVSLLTRAEFRDAVRKKTGLCGENSKEDCGGYMGRLLRLHGKIPNQKPI